MCSLIVVLDVSHNNLHSVFLFRINHSVPNNHSVPHNGGRHDSRVRQRNSLQRVRERDADAARERDADAARDGDAEAARERDGVAARDGDADAARVRDVVAARDGDAEVARERDVVSPCEDKKDLVAVQEDAPNGVVVGDTSASPPPMYMENLPEAVSAFMYAANAAMASEFKGVWIPAPYVGGGAPLGT